VEIRGTWETKRVWIGGREVLPERSLRVRNYSPDGFSWGDSGNGSAQLALALLLELTHEDLALLWYQEVKWQIIARLPQDDFLIDSQAIVDCVVNDVKAQLMTEERPQGRRPRPAEDEVRLATQATAVEVDYRYTREDLKAIFDLASDEDVERGGRYDGRSGAIHVYSHSWQTEMMRAESTLMGSFAAVWGQGNQIWQIEREDGFSLEDLLEELGTLEQKALGRKMYGR
jgi:hypothetical protein